MYLVNYHIVFCPRRRRKIFDVDGVEERFRTLVNIKCDELGIEAVTVRGNRDHAYLFLKCLPTHCPSDIIHNIKTYTSRMIRDEFSEFAKAGTLWTRHYFVSTAATVGNNIIKEYVESQPKTTSVGDRKRML